jgi:uncharacterized protein (TIGR04255 family)
MYEKVSSEYPIKEQRTMQSVTTRRGESGLEQEVQIQGRVVFLANNRQAFIQVGLGLVAVHVLKPYPAWNGFKPRIETAFRALTDVLEVKGLQRIGLRYVNRIEISEKPINLEDFFDFYPNLGPNLPQHLDSFIAAAQVLFERGRDACKFQLTDAVPENKGNIAFLLDLDYYLAKPAAVPTESALAWVEASHHQVEEVFEGCIKDRLRSIFGEVK